MFMVWNYSIDLFFTYRYDIILHGQFWLIFSHKIYVWVKYIFVLFYETLLLWYNGSICGDKQKKNRMELWHPDKIIKIPYTLAYNVDGTFFKCCNKKSYEPTHNNIVYIPTFYDKIRV